MVIQLEILDISCCMISTVLVCFLMIYLSNVKVPLAFLLVPGSDRDLNVTSYT